MIHPGQWALSSPGVIDIYTLCHVICDSGTVMHVIACLNGFATSILILSLLAHRRTFTNQVLLTNTNTCSQTRFPKPWKIVRFSRWKEKWDISFTMLFIHPCVLYILLIIITIIIDYIELLVSSVKKKF